MRTERIEIIVSENGSRVVRKNIEGVGEGASKSSKGVDLLTKALAALGLVAGAREVLRQADAFTTLQNRLRSTGAEGENLTAVYKSLLKVANDTRSSVEGSVELYSRLALSAKDLGVSQQQLIDFTKSLNQAITLSGASAEEAKAGLIQLSQGMASGTLRGDELNSVMEQLPVVADVIAKQLKVTRGELRTLGAEGKITAKDILTAFQGAAAGLDESFGKTVPTLGQSLTVLQNNFLDFIGQFDKATGLTTALSKVLLLVANNLDTVAKTIAGLASGVVIVGGLYKAFMLARSGMLALNAAVAANPLGALLVVLTSVVSTLVLFRDEIKLGVDETTTLGDVMRAVWEQIGPMVQTALDAVTGFFSSIAGTSSGTFDQMIDDLVGYEHASESTWLKVLRVVLKTFDMIGAVIRGTIYGVTAVIQQQIDLWVKFFGNLGGQVSAIMQGDFSKAFDLGQQNLAAFADNAKTLGSTFKDAFDAELQSQQDSGLEAWLDNTIKQAQEIGKARAAAEQGSGSVSTVAGPATPVIDPNAAKAAKKLKEDLDSLIGSYDRVYAAQTEVRKATELLDKAQAAGLITSERRAEILALISEQLKDQLDPLGAINREMDKELSLLKMTADAREVESQLQSIQNDLKSQGVKITDEEIQQLRDKLELTQQQNKLDQAKQALIGSSSTGQAKDFAVQVQAIKDLQASGAFSAGDLFTAINDALGGALENSKSYWEAQAEQYETYYARIQELRDQDVINEQQASEARAAIRKMELDSNLGRTEEALGAAAGLMKSNNKEAFKVGQAAAIGQAIVNTYTAATAAYQSAAAIPYVGWILGPIAAAGAVAAGMAQVSAIRSQQMPAYATGGTYTVGGSGGIDSQTIAMRATPGEQISINTPAQAHAMENLSKDLRQNGRGGRSLTQNVTIVQQGRPDNKTPMQEARQLRKAATKSLRSTVGVK